MKKFNNSDLFTGYLKQLLHTFNLPKIKVYTKQHEDYFNKYRVESPEILSTLEAAPSNKNQNVRYFPYIKDGEIQEYVNGSWQNIRENEIKPTALYKYSYGDKILNYTKNLKINSNIYDFYTHEYLGDYLRFHRDFLNLNLMPLYNCFSNRACDKLKLQWKLSSGATVSFDTADPKFKIFMIPVKLFQKYTIAIDSVFPIEMCCGVYGDYQDKRSKFSAIPHYTYKRISSSIFSQPFIYDTLAYNKNKTTNTFINQLLSSAAGDSTTLIELAQNESDLKLFLKVPANNNSTIVILEGDYCNWNNNIWKMSEVLPKQCNKSIINLDHTFKDIQQFDLVTPLQLLYLNTKEQHPFADRLIEYLIGNAITKSETEIYDNIRRAQKALASNYSTNNYIINLPGVWSNEMKILFYEYMTTNKLTNKFEINHDILGYVDKDVEKFYQATTKIAANTTGKISLANIELEEGDK